MPSSPRFRRRLPTREQLAANKWLRPLAPLFGRAALWQFNRHTVSRGVAVGLFFGLLSPVAQIVLAAVAAVALRANLAVAAAATLVTNPLTVPPIYYAAWHIGDWILGRDATAGNSALGGADGRWERWMAWLAEVGPSLALGLLVLAFACAVAGFLAVHAAWRLRVLLRRHRVRT